MSAAVEVVASAGGYAAKIELRAPDYREHRALEAQDCAVLSRAIAVVVAVGLDPVMVASRTQPEVEPVATPVPLPATSEPSPPRPEATVAPVATRTPDADVAAASTEPALEAGVRLGLGVGGLVLPGAGVGLGVAPWLGSARVHGRLALQYWVPRTRALPAFDDAGATIQLAAVGARVCGNLERGRWRFPLCGGADVGAMVGRGSGPGLAVARRATAAWVAIVVQPGVELAVGPRVGLWAAFEGAISVLRPQFHLEGGGTLHHAGRFGPRALFGIVIHNRRTIL